MSKRIGGSRTPKKKTMYLACEGGDSGTEATYLRQLCNKYNCAYVFISKNSADPLTLVNSAISFTPKIRASDNAEIWVVFDNDDAAKVREAFDKARRHNASVSDKKVGIHIAFNAPSVETWGLLCCGVKARPSLMVNLRALKSKMPCYSHGAKPFFDIDRMEAGYAAGLVAAKSLQASFDGEPEYTAPQYAGIYKLVESIKQ